MNQHVTKEQQKWLGVGLVIVALFFAGAMLVMLLADEAIEEEPPPGAGSSLPAKQLPATVDVTADNHHPFAPTVLCGATATGNPPVTSS